MKNKIFIAIVLFCYFAITTHANIRATLLVEYKLVHICIDKRTNGSHDTEVRDRCIRDVEQIIKDYCKNAKGEDDCTKLLRKTGKDGNLEKYFVIEKNR